MTVLTNYSPIFSNRRCIGAGQLLFALTPMDGGYFTDLLPTMILGGAGAGLGFPALMGLAMSGATPSGSGLVNTTVQLGGAIGLAGAVVP